MSVKAISGSIYTEGPRIGTGVYGDVYKVSSADGRVLAFKKFHEDDYKDLELGALRELSILRILQDNKEGIVSMVDIILSVNSIGVIMPYYPFNLSEVIRDKHLTRRQQDHIAQQLVKTLAFLKENHILHRDIKPENVLLDETYSPILADFSLSKVIGGIGAKGSHTGGVSTLTYRAPEIVDHKPYDYPADMWSLGVLLYEMYKQKLIQNDKDQEIISLLLSKPLYFKDESLNLLIKGLLQKDPEKRLTPSLALMNPVLKTKYQPSRLWKVKGECKVSDEIRKWCEIFESKKEASMWAAQTYYDKTPQCHPSHAVALACKMYEIEYQDYSELPGYVNSERAILRSMNYNLFI